MLEEMETETETKKRILEVQFDEICRRNQTAGRRGKRVAFVRRKTIAASWKGKTVHIPQVDTPVDLGKEEKQNIPLVELTDEQKAIFSYFMPVKGMEDQLCKALTAASSHLKNKETASRGNLVIKGGRGNRTNTCHQHDQSIEQGFSNRKVKLHAEAFEPENVSEVLRWQEDA